MKRAAVIDAFLNSETVDVGGYSVAHGWELVTMQTLLPPEIEFPRVLRELYDGASFCSFDSPPITFLGNDDGNASEMYTYFEDNKDFVRQCCTLGYLPFARIYTGDYDPVCFDLNSNKPSQGDFAIVVLDHEPLLQFDKAVIKEQVSKSLYQFMRSKIET